MQYCVRCPHCHLADRELIEDTALWPGNLGDRPGGAEYPGDPSEPHQCSICHSWMQIVLIGQDLECTVKKCEAPQPDPPEILGTGL